MNLDSAVPFASLAAADEKNRQGAEIALRDDLAADLREWLTGKLQRIQSEASASSGRIPARLPPDTPLFDVPDKLSKILNRDLKLAGIDKRDDRGRVVDVHALRHTFGTLLSKGGVTPRTAQSAMRHAKIDLTMSVYTDPRLLDVRAALDALPALPLDSNTTEGESLRATGTNGKELRRFPLAPLLAPLLAPNADNGTKSPTIADSLSSNEPPSHSSEPVAVSAYSVNKKEPLTTAVSGSLCLGATGLEPVTPSLSSWYSSQLS